MKWNWTWTDEWFIQNYEDEFKHSSSEMNMKWIEKRNEKWTWSELWSEMWSEPEVNCEEKSEVNIKWIELRNEMWS